MANFEPIIQLVFNNKGLKIMALVLAVGSWYAVKKTINFESVVTEIPLTIKVEKGWAVLERSASTVDILFRGSRDAVLLISKENTEVEVDLRAESFRTNSIIQLYPKHVRTLGNARAIQIRPNTLTMTLDKESEKQVPLKVDIVGEPPAGYVVERTVCTPASVVVNGPLTRLNEIDAIWTVPLELEGRMRSFKLQLPVTPPSESWAGHVEPNRVEVAVELVERASTQELKDVPVWALLSPERSPQVSIYPAKVSILVMGPTDVLERNRISKDDLHAYVDCVELQPSARYELPVRCHVPSGVTIQKIEPDIVKVQTSE